MPVYHESSRLVHNHALHESNFVKYALQAFLLLGRVNAPVFGVSQ